MKEYTSEVKVKALEEKGTKCFCTAVHEKSGQDFKMLTRVQRLKGAMN